MNERFAKEAGVAQTVHWARTKQMGFVSQDVIDALIDSELSIEEGLIDGVFARLGEEDEDGNLLSFGQATHVGCGWIQFPSMHEDETEMNIVPEYADYALLEDFQPQFENFMVCNYAIGVPGKTMCANDTSNTISLHKQKQFIRYYHASAEVIGDVKKCLGAVRCARRSKAHQLKLIGGSTRGNIDPCTNNVESCLIGKSGLKFISPSKLQDVARSNDIGVIDLEASKCKIDTILCRLFKIIF